MVQLNTWAEWLFSLFNKANKSLSYMQPCEVQQAALNCFQPPPAVSHNTVLQCLWIIDKPIQTIQAGVSEVGKKKLWCILHLLRVIRYETQQFEHLCNACRQIFWTPLHFLAIGSSFLHMVSKLECSRRASLIGMSLICKYENATRITLTISH